MEMYKRGITIVGGGEVFLQRYIPALADLSWPAPFYISDVIDICDSEDLRSRIQHVYPDSAICVHQLDATSTGSIISVLRENLIEDQPILISTPTNTHVSYARSLLSKGCRVCIEKPLAASLLDLSSLNQLVDMHGMSRLFLFGYYALEKGLPLLILGRSGLVPKQYLAKIQPGPSEELLPGTFRTLRTKLGRLRSVHGVLLEGAGQAGSLHQRPWVLDDSNGGNTVETFYHLLCLILPFIRKSASLSVDDVKLGLHGPTASWYYSSYSRYSAETYTSARLQSQDGVDIILACGKYVPAGMHKRWIRLVFDNGVAFMDLEASNLRIEGGFGNFSFRIKYTTKYATQFSLWSDKMDDPSMQVELGLFADALTLCLAIREEGLRSGFTCYDEASLAADGFEAVISGDISGHHLKPKPDFPSGT